MSALRVVVADDNFLVREGVRRLLQDGDDVEVVAEAASAPELMRTVREHRPAAVLTDIRMPPHAGMDGVHAALAIRTELPGTGVVVLSQYADAAYARALFADGTTGLGYLLKESVGDRDELVRALGLVAAGGSVVAPPVVDALLRSQRAERASRLSALTPRERDVLREMARGMTNGAIARQLHLSESAVSKNIAGIFGKLDLHEDRGIDRRVRAVLYWVAESEGLRDSAA